MDHDGPKPVPTLALDAIHVDTGQGFFTVFNCFKMVLKKLKEMKQLRSDGAHGQEKADGPPVTCRVPKRNLARMYATPTTVNVNKTSAVRVSDIVRDWVPVYLKFECRAFVPRFFRIAVVGGMYSLENITQSASGFVTQPPNRGKRDLKVKMRAAKI